jgi:hypothetical protein
MATEKVNYKEFTKALDNLTNGQVEVEEKAEKFLEVSKEEVKDVSPNPLPLNLTFKKPDFTEQEIKLINNKIDINEKIVEQINHFRSISEENDKIIEYLGFGYIKSRISQFIKDGKLKCHNQFDFKIISTFSEFILDYLKIYSDKYRIFQCHNCLSYNEHYVYRKKNLDACLVTWITEQLNDEMNIDNGPYGITFGTHFIEYRRRTKNQDNEMTDLFFVHDKRDIKLVIEDDIKILESLKNIQEYLNETREDKITFGFNSLCNETTLDRIDHEIDDLDREESLYTNFYENLNYDFNYMYVNSIVTRDFKKNDNHNEAYGKIKAGRLKAIKHSAVASGFGRGNARGRGSFGSGRIMGSRN